jgi:hypothetical protein
LDEIFEEHDETLTLATEDIEYDSEPEIERCERIIHSYRRNVRVIRPLNVMAADDVPIKSSPNKTKKMY